MKKGLLLTVGNGMMGDDAAGPLLARMIQRAPLDDWEVLNGGAVPENCLHLIREAAPEQVLIIDAADMGLEPGEVRQVAEERITGPDLITTHTMPLIFLMQSIQEFVPKVALVGIQPEIVAFGYPVSPRVLQAVELVYTRLKQREWAWESLENESDSSSKNHFQ